MNIKIYDLFLSLRHMIPPSQKEYNLKDDRLLLEKYHISWDAIDQFLKKTNLFNKSPGFFVEAGAYDGEFLSNTLYLERRLGWTGLLIEPDEVLYQRLLSKNRKSWTSQVCLSTNSYPEEVTFACFLIF